MRSLPLLAVLGAAVCGCSTAPPGAVDLRPWSPPSGQACDAVPPHYALPDLVDVAATRSRVAALAPPDGGLLLSVFVDSTGAASLRRIETTLPLEAARAAEAAFRESVREGVAGTGVGRVVLRVGSGVVRELSLGPSVTCPPKLANGRTIQRLLRRAYEQGREEGVATVRVHVDTTGAVLEGHVEGPSGSIALDERILEVARQMEFHPALLDRETRAIWVAVRLGVDAVPAAEPGGIGKAQGSRSRGRGGRAELRADPAGRIR